MKRARAARPIEPGVQRRFLLRRQGSAGFDVHRPDWSRRDLAFRFDKQSKRVVARRTGGLPAGADAEDRRQYARLAERWGQLGAMPRLTIDLKVDQAVLRNRRAAQALDADAVLADVARQDRRHSGRATRVFPDDLSWHFEPSPFRGALFRPALTTLHESKPLLHGVCLPGGCLSNLV